MKEKKNQELWDRAAALASRLTLEEKADMIHGAQLFQTKGVERLGIPPLCMSDGPMGVRQEFEPDSWREKNQNDDFVSYLPCNSALAATWNRRRAREVGSVLGEEARGRGKDVILAPGINIKRSPLCGRNFEYFSEDPCLTKELAASYVQGVQQWDVAACVKHFALNNQETERLWVDVEVEEQALREIYLPAFYETLVNGGAYSVMGAYNLIKGEHCCQSPFLLNKILREEWDYDGVVISDWGAVHDTKKAALSQLDIEMSVTSDFNRYYMADPLLEKIRAGEIPETVMDEKVIHILMLMMRLNMLTGTRKTGAINTKEHQERALRAARESIVLLKNSAGVLPLKKQEVRRLLVIGDNAVRLHSDGGGSAQIKSLYEICPLLGLKMLLGGNVQVDYVPGYLAGTKKEDLKEEKNWQETSLSDGGGAQAKTIEEKENCAVQERLRKEAVTLAREYEHVVFIGGLNHDQDSEGLDRADMKLPYGQDALIQELLCANPGTIIVLQGGSPVEMGAWLSEADTLIWCWYGGMEGGTALAEVLFGEVNPSGKLPETFYMTHSDCSAHALGEFPGGKTVSYGEGIFVGYRYNDTFGVKPNFCFGHGLSYTNFSYSGPAVCIEGQEIIVSCEVENTGDRDGAEVVQVYRLNIPPEIDGKREGNMSGADTGRLEADGPGRVKRPLPQLPAKELKGFEKVFLKAGERKRLEIRMEKGYETDMVSYGIGASLEDLRLFTEWRWDNGMSV